MPPSAQELDANLDRLRLSLRVCCAAPAGHEAAARRAAERMPLSHATTETFLEDVLSSGALLSADARGAVPRNMDRELETTNDVFFYLGTAAFPHKEMAFIFAASLTEEMRARAIATPFDSGGCMGRFRLPAGKNGVGFVREHEMPVPVCRDYLGDY